MYFICKIVHEIYKQKSVEQSKNVHYQDHENLIPYFLFYSLHKNNGNELVI